jgi:hypothetical protein
MCDISASEFETYDSRYDTSVRKRNISDRTYDMSVSKCEISASGFEVSSGVIYQLGSMPYLIEHAIFISRYRISV